MNIGQETKDFHKWVNDTFTWIDNDAKKLMFRSWCACAKNRDMKELKDKK